MPIVIIEQDGIQRGCVLEPRTLIGRWTSNGIVIDHASVSRVHAWISQRDDGCYLTDAQSRTGTRVNGKTVTLRHRLKDQDQIQIGPCRLTFQIRFGLPEGIEPIGRPDGSDTGFPGTGILFDCHCGAPLWAPEKMAGYARRCHYCRAPIIIPPRSGMTAEAPVDNGAVEPAAGAVTCSICQWRIDARQQTAKCPECGLEFHAECWAENKGCSSYGCSQVNALAAPVQSEADIEIGSVPDADAPRAGSWERVLLTASIAASLIGVLAFGVPALIVAVASIMYYFRTTDRGVSVTIASVVSLLGVAAGIAASYWWWL